MGNLNRRDITFRFGLHLESSGRGSLAPFAQRCNHESPTMEPHQQRFLSIGSRLAVADGLTWGHHRMRFLCPVELIRSRILSPSQSPSMLFATLSGYLFFSEPRGDGEASSASAPGLMDEIAGRFEVYKVKPGCLPRKFYWEVWNAVFEDFGSFTKNREAAARAFGFLLNLSRLLAFFFSRGAQSMDS